MEGLIWYPIGWLRERRNDVLNDEVCTCSQASIQERSLQTMKKMVVHIYLVIVSIVSIKGMNEASGT